MKKDIHIPENIEGSLEEFTPKLSSVNKDNPFSVPADYFDTLPGKIIERCSLEKENSFALKFKIIFNPRFYAPVAILIIIIAFIIFKPPVIKTASNNQQMVYNDIENMPEYQYVNSLIDNGEIDESLLMETAAGLDDTSKSIKPLSNLEKNISDMNKSTVIINDSIQKIVITDDDIIQYLLDNSDNYDIINNE